MSQQFLNMDFDNLDREELPIPSCKLEFSIPKQSDVTDLFGFGNNPPSNEPRPWMQQPVEIIPQKGHPDSVDAAVEQGQNEASDQQRAIVTQYQRLVAPPQRQVQTVPRQIPMPGNQLAPRRVQVIIQGQLPIKLTHNLPTTHGYSFKEARRKSRICPNPKCTRFLTFQTETGKKKSECIQCNTTLRLICGYCTQPLNYSQCSNHYKDQHPDLKQLYLIDCQTDLDACRVEWTNAWENVVTGARKNLCYRRIRDILGI